MSILFDDNVYLHERIIPGRAGDGIDNAEAAALRADVQSVLDRPDVRRLLDLLDVTGTPEDGATLVYNEDDDEWQVGSVTGAIARVDDHNSVEVESNVSRITANVGLTAERSGSGWARIYVRFAGSGSSNTAARSDHAHRLRASIREPIIPGGYMSGGSRMLATRPVTLPANTECRVLARLNVQMRGADPGPCYYQVHLNVGGDIHTTPGGQSGAWCVQGVPDGRTFWHAPSFTGDGTAISVSASVSYHSGGGFYTDFGDLEIHVDYNR